MTKPDQGYSEEETFRRLHGDIVDSLDEELELELEDGKDPDKDARKRYFRELFRLQGELVKLQDWVMHAKHKLVILFEGRDAAGKGGVIKRITQRLNPRVCRVAALPAPNDRERISGKSSATCRTSPRRRNRAFRTQLYNRAGFERPVIGFLHRSSREFFRDDRSREDLAARDPAPSTGIPLGRGAELRFKARIPRSPEAVELSPRTSVRRRWEQYTKSKEVMLERTHIPEAPWFVVQAVDKKKARLNCIHHLLQQVPYNEVPQVEVVLPKRERNQGYRRSPTPVKLMVPEVY